CWPPSGRRRRSGSSPARRPAPGPCRPTTSPRRRSSWASTLTGSRGGGRWRRRWPGHSSSPRRRVRSWWPAPCTSWARPGPPSHNLPPMTTADRTLVSCKPDAVERRLVGEIVSRLERKGLRIVEMRMQTIRKEIAGQHYGEHQGKPFYDDLVAFITRGPAVLMVVEGPEAYAVVRTLMGATNPRQAAPGTIRGDLAIELTENLVHGSDSPESAAREIALFF